MRYGKYSGWTISAALALSLSVSVTLQGQTGGQSGSSGRTTSGIGSGSMGGLGNNSSTSSSIPGRSTTSQPQSSSNGPRPIYVSGKVVTDAGTPPPDSVTMELVCGSTIRPQGYTDSKGRFGFQLGQNQSVFMDASSSAPGTNRMASAGSSSSSSNPLSNQTSGGSVSERSLMGCDLRANLAGYRAEAVNLAGHRVMDNPDVGTIILHRLANVEGTVVSASSLAAPKDARKSYEKGRDLLRKDKWDDASRQFQKAVDAYPKYAEAWFELGRCRHHENNVAEARKAYGQALEIDPKFIKPYLPMALLAASEGNWPGVLQFSGKSLKLDPVSYPEAFFYNAAANLKLNNLGEAEKVARQGLKVDTTNRVPKMNYLLGMILADKQDYPGAATHLRYFLDLAPRDPDAGKARKQLAEIEKFASAAAAPKSQP